MLETLAIRGFRGFESYRFANLTRMNLLVGKNNCGKTSVLDEISIQKLHGSLTQAACLRGDNIRVAVEQDIEVR